MSDDDWKKKLTPEQYHILREKGTEAPGSGKFIANQGTGMYQCVACGNQLFSSETKFDSDCGWPAFDKAITGNIEFLEDNSFGMHRTEVRCNRCGGHLGHVFDDGPTSTGKRFCINSAILKFTPGEEREKEERRKG